MSDKDYFTYSDIKLTLKTLMGSTIKAEFSVVISVAFAEL